MGWEDGRPTGKPLTRRERAVQEHTTADFLDAIRAHPDCDVRRLAFADFLEETGTDVGWARFLRWGVTHPRPVEFLVQHSGTTAPAGSQVTYKWSNIFGDKKDRYRGMCGWVRSHLPHPGPWVVGVTRRAVFRRGLLEHLAVPNAWWLEHGDAVVAKTGLLEVVTPQRFDAQFDESVPFLYDTDPSHGIYQTRRRCKETAFIILEDGRISVPPILKEEWPSATFRVSPTGA